MQYPPLKNLLQRIKLFYSTFMPTGASGKMLDEILQELEKATSNDIMICKIDIDKNQDLQKHFAIMSVPTLMIYKDGVMVWRMPGFELAQDLKKRIEGFLV